MSNFKEASRVGLRFSTNKGMLNVEQLWGLTITELDTLAVQLEAHVESSTRKSFVVKKTEKDKTAKLKFDIVLEILEDKIDERDAASKKKEDKAHNDKILALIAKKQEGELEGKTVEELTAMLK